MTDKTWPSRARFLEPHELPSGEALAATHAALDAFLRTQAQRRRARPSQTPPWPAPR
jgi:hypothetical protein